MNRSTSLGAILMLCSLLGMRAAAQEEMKVLSASMHGLNMSIEHVVLNSGDHLLVVKRLAAGGNRKILRTTVQTVQLGLKKGELLSLQESYLCTDSKGSAVYGVLSQGLVNSKAEGAPLRAWRVNEAALRLEVMADPSGAGCRWQRNGDT